MKARDRIFILIGLLLIISVGWYFFSTHRSGDLHLIGTVDANEVDRQLADSRPHPDLDRRGGRRRHRPAN